MKRRESYREGVSLYLWSFASHHVQGAGAAVALLAGEPDERLAALCWTGLYVAYQALTRIRKQDAAGLDVLDYMVGFGIGMAVVKVYEFVM